MPYINADLSHPLARVSVEEVYRDWQEALAWVHGVEVGFLPTSEQEQAARDAAGYVLCVEPDTTDDGTVIPEWAFE
jgi:hypothetical protein